MEARTPNDSESVRDEKVKVLKAIEPLDLKDVVRGQFHGYRNETGVAPESQVETFTAYDWALIPGAGRESRSTSGLGNACP